LLDNPALLLRDVQDVLSGGSLASRSIAGQLVRPALSELATARTGEEVVAATSSLEKFPETVLQSQNPAAILRRFGASQESLFQSGGTKFLETITPSLANLSKELGKPETIKAIEAVGVAVGSLVAHVNEFGQSAIGLGTGLVNA